MPLSRFYVALVLLASPAIALPPDGVARLRGMTTGQLSAVVVHDAPKAAIEAAFIDADGETRHVTEWPGEVVFVNIWATWCPPCLREMPSIARLARAMPDETFEVVAISTDRGGPEKPLAWLQENGAGDLNFYQDDRFRVARAAATPGQPATLILDRQGREVARLIGGAEWDAPEAQAFLRAVIEETAR